MKTSLSYLGALTIALCNTNVEDGQSATRPNLLLIMTDDLGWGDISCYGASNTRTPNIDRLASNGVRMTNFHASAANSSPSRAALITGCFPDLVGLQGVVRADREHNYGDLKNDIPTLPVTLKSAGYNTCLLGKWHLGHQSPDLPNDRGFDYFKGLLSGMVSDNFTHLLKNKNYMKENRKEIHTSGVHITDLFTGWALDYLDTTSNQENPFFLFLSYTAPHTPIQPTEASLQRVLDREKNIDIERAKYIALIEHVDESIGKVVNKLDETGQLENTIIIFMSDNGGNLKVQANNGPYRGGKTQLWEGGLKVPFIINNPKLIEKGLEPEQTMTTMDIFPSLLDLVGLQEYIPSSIHGTSFASLFRGKQFAMPERNLYFVYRDGWNVMGLPSRAIMFDGWKVLQNSALEDFQYVNLVEDKLEKHPLNAHEAPAEIAKKFRNLMVEHLSEVATVPWQRQN